MSVCKKCGADLTNDEIALTKRLIGKAETEFLCLSCLSQYFLCSEELLRQKIQHFKAMGCTLFATDESN